jgi:hypothetical protein
VDQGTRWAWWHLAHDRETGKALAITLWADEENMRQSEESANEHRRRVSEEMASGQAPTVERYEVAVFDA